jgi:hypothetical protein
MASLARERSRPISPVLRAKNKLRGYAKDRGAREGERASGGSKGVGESDLSTTLSPLSTFSSPILPKKKVPEREGYERENVGGALSEREKVFSGRLSIFSPRVGAVNKSGGTPGSQELDHHDSYLQSE